MDRYEKQNAAERVNSYFYPEPYERALGKHFEVFDRAKNETLRHMREALRQTEELTADEFFAQTKRGKFVREKCL
jgi:hypothetical protein